MAEAAVMVLVLVLVVVVLVVEVVAAESLGSAVVAVVCKTVRKLSHYHLIQ